MKAIFGTVLLGALLTLAPSTAWSQLPALSYTGGVGAATDITGAVYNPGIAWVMPDGGIFNPCPPTVAYGQNDGFGDPPRQTGGDGVSTTADANPLNTGGRTEATFALADAQDGYARAFAAADASTPCIVFENGSIFMGALGLAVAQFYQTYTVGAAPTASAVDLNWTLNGSFSSLTSGWGGGYASLRIYLLTVPPTEPVPGEPLINGSAVLVGQDLSSTTWWDNAGCIWQGPCQPEQKAPLINAGGTIDLRSAFEYASSARPMTAGDSFIIAALLWVTTRTCGFPDGCDLLPAFTTDFAVSATVTANDGAVVFPGMFD